MKGEFGRACVECGNFTHNRCDRCCQPICNQCKKEGIGPTVAGRQMGIFCSTCYKLADTIKGHKI